MCEALCSLDKIDWKNKLEKWSNILWYVKLYMYWEYSIQQLEEGFWY